MLAPAPQDDPATRALSAALAQAQERLGHACARWAVSGGGPEGPRVTQVVEDAEAQVSDLEAEMEARHLAAALALPPGERQAALLERKTVIADTLARLAREVPLSATLTVGARRRAVHEAALARVTTAVVSLVPASAGRPASTVAR
jgi:hypothetical protein